MSAGELMLSSLVANESNPNNSSSRHGGLRRDLHANDCAKKCSNEFSGLLGFEIKLRVSTFESQRVETNSIVNVSSFFSFFSIIAVLHFALSVSPTRS